MRLNRNTNPYLTWKRMKRGSNEDQVCHFTYCDKKHIPKRTPGTWKYVCGYNIAYACAGHKQIKEA